MKDSQFEQLMDALSSLDITAGEMLKAHTTIKVGGPARIFVNVRSEQDVLTCLGAVRTTGVPLLVLGNGSNCLVCDSGFDGVVLHFGRDFAQIKVEGDEITAEAGALLSSLAGRAAENSLTGLEFAAGIPGSVGGAALMNAGAFGQETCQVMVGARCVMPDGSIQTIDNAGMCYGYRKSRAMYEGLVILSVTFALAKGNQDTIYATMQDMAQRRKANQPLTYPSAGSFFKRPVGHYAGALIEQAGLKGCTVGGAMVSDLHAGFLINTGTACAQDFFNLAKEVQDKVQEQFQVALEPEVRFVEDET